MKPNPLALKDCALFSISFLLFIVIGLSFRRGRQEIVVAFLLVLSFRVSFPPLSVIVVVHGIQNSGPEDPLCPSHLKMGKQVLMAHMALSWTGDGTSVLGLQFPMETSGCRAPSGSAT